MKKYAIAFWSDHTGSLEMDILYANSPLEAGKQYLMSEGDNDVLSLMHLTTLNELQNFVHDQDSAINVIEVNETNWKKYSTASSAAMPVSIQ